MKFSRVVGSGEMNEGYGTLRERKKLRKPTPWLSRGGSEPGRRRGSGDRDGAGFSVSPRLRGVHHHRPLTRRPSGQRHPPLVGSNDDVVAALALSNWHGGGSELGASGGAVLCVLEFVAEVGEGEVDAFDLAEPALVVGVLAALLEVALDLGEPGDHLGADVEHGTADAGEPPRVVRRPLVCPGFRGVEVSGILMPR